MSGHDNLWVGNLMPGLRKTIEQIVCDYELYAINKNCLFDIIPPKCIIYSKLLHQIFSTNPHSFRVQGMSKKAVLPMLCRTVFYYAFLGIHTAGRY